METSPVVKDFLGAAVKAGIKKKDAYDMALIYSKRPAVVAACFTTNRVKAAPVRLSAHRVKIGLSQAVVVNSGNANACTGLQGERDAQELTHLVASQLEIPDQLVLSCSTGVIGLPLPMEKMKKAVPQLVAGLRPDAWPVVAKALMTTDTFPKMVYRQGEIDGQVYNLLGLAKGAGMIQPNMATMLAFFLTDIAITPALLQPMFKEIVSLSFNRISVDGDTSTNDTALILANGAAGNEVFSPERYQAFKESLLEVATSLARMIARDGEGASKLIELRVKEALSLTEADQIARTVLNSPLVKTAIYGEDANWGRIMAAIGRSGVAINPERIDIFFGDIQIVEGGIGKGSEAEKAANQYLKNKEVTITIDLHQGTAQTTWFGCDLTEDYIRINAGYRS